VSDWLEAMRAHVEEQLGDQVAWVGSSAGYHGGWHGIAIRTSDGYRHAVAVAEGDMPEVVAWALQTAIDERRKHLAVC